MKVRELLDSPAKWTRGSRAKDVDGRACHPTDPSAVCYCLMGAIEKCYPPDEFVRVMEKIRMSFNIWSIVKWNDLPTRTFSEVKILIEELDI